MTTAVSELRSIIEDRLSHAPASRYKYPLGYVTWGADEIMAALECLLIQSTTMWTKTEKFEEEFAAYIGSENAVMVNSGSSADLVMMLAARELGLLKPGDEILIPAVTWPTQVWAAIQVPTCAYCSISDHTVSQKRLNPFHSHTETSQRFNRQHLAACYRVIGNTG